MYRPAFFILSALFILLVDSAGSAASTCHAEAVQKLKIANAPSIKLVVNHLGEECGRGAILARGYDPKGELVLVYAVAAKPRQMFHDVDPNHAAVQQLITNFARVKSGKGLPPIQPKMETQAGSAVYDISNPDLYEYARITGSSLICLPLYYEGRRCFVATQDNSLYKPTFSEGL